MKYFRHGFREGSVIDIGMELFPGAACEDDKIIDAEMRCGGGVGG